MRGRVRRRWPGDQCAMDVTINPSLKSVLAAAFQPCPGFSGACSAMRWNPAAGHVPRGFFGATGTLEEVRLVLILSEPGDPGIGERHDGPESAYAYAAECYL